MNKIAKKLFFSIPLAAISYSLLIVTYPFVTFWRFKSGKKSRDTSWEFGRKLIFDLGISYWKDMLLDFRLDIKDREVLEVGSGNGQWLIALDALESRKVVGVEPNDNIREYSLERMEEYSKIGRIKVDNASAESLPYPDASFDCVLCMGVFMFTRQQKALEEFHRVLRPGGQLVLTVNGLGYFIMKAKDGILFSKVKEIRYGLSGIINTLLKWATGFQAGTSAVNVSEMRNILKEREFQLQRVWLHNSIDLYPLEHCGFPTNYAFRAVKKD